MDKSRVEWVQGIGVGEGEQSGAGWSDEDEIEYRILRVS